MEKNISGRQNKLINRRRKIETAKGDGGGSKSTKKRMERGGKGRCMKKGN